MPEWLIQVPLIGAFIWFTLQLNKSHQATIDKLITDSRSSNVAVMQDWRNYLKQRDDQWQSFLVEQRNTTNEALDVMADRMAEISRAVADLDNHVRGKIKP